LLGCNSQSTAFKRNRHRLGICKSKRGHVRYGQYALLGRLGMELRPIGHAEIIGRRGGEGAFDIQLCMLAEDYACWIHEVQICGTEIKRIKRIERIVGPENTVDGR